MLTLTRYPEYLSSVPGRLDVNGRFVCYTLERPWRNNASNISCIPVGTYKLKRTYSPKFKRILWQVMDVPGRGGIRIHTANLVTELSGCIAPCKVFSITKEVELFGSGSISAYLDLATALGDIQETTLTIV